jgi:integrative and conjugative element protein (TIGR02256 family)
MATATPTARTLWIAVAALTQMRELAAGHAPLETGGMLLGYDADNHEAVVTNIIGPGPKARHRRMRFRPDHEYQQERLERHFALTEGRETYLGDWHTHPSGSCDLSWLDKRVLVRIAKTPAARTAHPIMLVLADGKPEWRVCANRLLAFRSGLLSKVELGRLIPETFS